MSTPKNPSPPKTRARVSEASASSVDEFDDYIDIELITSPKAKPEFEFQTGRDPSAFPADDLFYNGKLLPLLLPSRRQMLHHLSSSAGGGGGAHHHHHSAPPTDTLNTPTESCRVSCELNPDDYFFHWSTDLNSNSNNNNKNNKNVNNVNYYYSHLSRKNLAWPKKLGRKLKAYLKPIFTARSADDSNSSREIANEHVINNNAAKTTTPKTIASIMKGTELKDGVEEDNHRRSFSRAIKRHSPVKCLSSSSSSSASSSSSSSSVSNNSSGSNGLGRSSSATEIEGSIEAAIAHCKRTFEGLGSSGKSETGVLAFSVSRDDVEGCKRTGACSI
ncbi:Unknown protein [Striga hermonthica]|uniref:Membrane-associated kinase regulator 4 n=1 Tax=Striga hermonthica TaxID=68872 RepID=A0A9N7NJB0_STRHE|nr:Unknown protein [Striga hermonthica]